MKLLSHYKHYAVLLAAGAIFPLGLAPFMFWPAVIVSMAVLFKALEAASLRQAYVRTFIYAVGLFTTGASWVFVSIHEYGFLPAPIAATATLLFCIFLASIFAIPFMLAALIPQTQAAYVLGLPSIWILSEWLRMWFLTGFPWLYAGYGHTDTWLSGWAPIGGVLLLSLLSAIGSASIAYLRRGDFKHRPTKILCAMVLAIWLTGLGLQQINWTEAEGDKLTVTLVQPNIPQNQKWSADVQASILQQLYQQSESHWNSDLILWPEAAIPAVAQQIPRYIQQLESKSIASKSTLLTGIIHYDPTEKKYYNSILALGDGAQRYDKTRLVPFGEYVPLEFLLRGALDFFNLPLPALSLGKPHQRPFIVNQQNIGASICYEVVYPDLIARTSIDSNIMLTVSNDAWFGDSIGPHQHMQMVRMRALETAKPMMRATNNGISGFIDYNGQITQVAIRNLMTELTATVQPRVGSTLFSHTGSWPTIVLALLICAALIRQQRKIPITKG